MGGGGGNGGCGVELNFGIQIVKQMMYDIYLFIQHVFISTCQIKMHLEDTMVLTAVIRTLTITHLSICT